MHIFLIPATMAHFIETCIGIIIGATAFLIIFFAVTFARDEDEQKEEDDES